MSGKGSFSVSRFLTVGVLGLSSICAADANATVAGCRFRTGEADRCADRFNVDRQFAAVIIYSTATANEAGKSITRTISLERQLYTRWDVVFKRTNLTGALQTFQVGAFAGTYKIMTASESRLPGTVDVSLVVTRKGY